MGGGLAAGLLAGNRVGAGAGPVEIAMRGNADGSRVGFDPVGLHLDPGRTVRWVNLDAGNAHTATAYHPAIMDRPQRVPETAEPWDSDYLFPGEDFSLMLTVPGVYDYYCVPHEHAGMVGRIVVGEPQATWSGYPDAPADGAALPEVALSGLPSVADILEHGVVPGRRQGL
ncbi:MAG: hypothetical protein JJ913_14940 [Rhizobiaceae bacterium]|nr:hypothetical protein [Rhizobiaceae bacterium]